MPPKKRRRRTPEEAKKEILDAAERRLGEGGPDGIRLQQIAADVGVSHPAVLHHFGSREELIRAVVGRAIESLEAELIAALTEARDDAAPAFEMIERAFRVLVEKGHGRVVAWLLLCGHATEAEAERVRAVAEVVHRRRQGLAAAGRAPDFEDTLFRTLLIALVLLGEAVAGGAMRESAGLGKDRDAGRRFRQWLARLVVEEQAIEPEPTG